MEEVGIPEPTGMIGIDLFGARGELVEQLFDGLSKAGLSDPGTAK